MPPHPIPLVVVELAALSRPQFFFVRCQILPRLRKLRFHLSRSKQPRACSFHRIGEQQISVGSGLDEALGLGARDEVRIAELIELFELAALADRPINRLSTGERTRVLLARALAARPRLVMLDEPYANLEPYWVLRLGAILREYATGGTLVLVALHDLGQINRFDRALLIADGAVQMDEAPADLIASERFEDIFRITAVPGGWAIRPADRQSSR